MILNNLSFTICDLNVKKRSLNYSERLTTFLTTYEYLVNMVIDYPLNLFYP